MIEDTIIPKIPTHEPFLRGQKCDNAKFFGDTPTQTTDSQKAGNEIAKDPSSAEGQTTANNQALHLMKMFMVYREKVLQLLEQVMVLVVSCRNLSENFQGLINDLEATGYEIRTLHGYVNRTTRGGNKPSFHSMGAAIDINAYSPNGYAQNAPSGWDPR